MPASTQWAERLVYSGAATGYPPFGVGFRSWGPTDKAFLYFEKQKQSLPEGYTVVQQYTCSNNDGCATSTLNTADVVGAVTPFTHLRHPSIAVRNGSGTLKLDLVSVQKRKADCDSDGSTVDAIEAQALDLEAYEWDQVTRVGTGRSVEVNHTLVNDACFDHGMSSTRFDGSTALTCATQKTTPLVAGSDGDQIVCDDDASATTEWVHEEVLQTLPGAAFEDHPWLDQYGSVADRVVVAHYKSGSQHEIRALFPDSAAVVTLAGPTVTWLNHPSVVAANGKIHVAWEEGQDGTAAIKYRSCAFSATVPCTSVGQWDVNTTDVVAVADSYHNDAAYPHIIVDGNNQFVLFQYDSDGDSGPTEKDYRVRLATRCDGGAWTSEAVRGPDVPTDDQIVEVGRPAIALNRDEQIVHVAFVELNDYRGGSIFNTVNDGDLYWDRRSYTACP